MRETGHAPARLDLVQEFVNTLDVEEATDALADPAAAERWMRSQELLEDSPPISEAGRKRLLATREALREMLLANNTGVPAPPEAVAAINREAQDAPLGLRFEAEGAELVCAGTGVDRAIAQLLALVYEAGWDGTWSRLKVCPAENCRWAFYDRSRNRAATWCQMGECGNRSKARAYRARHRDDA